MTIHRVTAQGQLAEYAFNTTAADSFALPFMDRLTQVGNILDTNVTPVIGPDGVEATINGRTLRVEFSQSSGLLGVSTEDELIRRLDTGATLALDRIVAVDQLGVVGEVDFTAEGYAIILGDKRIEVRSEFNEARTFGTDAQTLQTRFLETVLADLQTDMRVGSAGFYELIRNLDNAPYGFSAITYIDNGRTVFEAAKDGDSLTLGDGSLSAQFDGVSADLADLLGPFARYFEIVTEDRALGLSGWANQVTWRAGETVLLTVEDPQRTNDLSTVDLTSAADLIRLVSDSIDIVNLSDLVTTGRTDLAVDLGAGNDLLNVRDSAWRGVSLDPISVDGGADTDAFVLDWNAERVQIDLVAGTVLAELGGQTVFSASLSNFENLRASGATGGQITLSGNDASNALTVTSATSASLFGRGGTDLLYGAGASDTLEGGEGGDYMLGGGGFDFASYANATSGVAVSLTTGTGSRGEALGDRLVQIEGLLGSALNDVFYGNAGGNRIEGGAGNDFLAGYGGNDALFGDAGNDRLLGGSGNDALFGGLGADRLEGGAGRDGVGYASSASAVVVNLAAGVGAGGEAAGDRYLSIENATGSAFNDVFIGSADANIFIGGAGNDVFRGGAGADVMNGGDGIDRVTYDTATTGVNVSLFAGVAAGGEGTGDRLISIENVTGSNSAERIIGSQDANVLQGNGGNDQILGLDGDDLLQGGAGVDILRGGAGADRIDGGDGADWTWYVNSSAAVVVNLTAGLGFGGDAQGDIYTDIEFAFGSVHDDVLVGDAGGNYLVGFSGDDAINGRDGNDRLRGHRGEDTLTGGEGADLFDFDIGDGRDVVTDFTDDVDKIDLRGYGFSDVASAFATARQDGAHVVFDLVLASDELVLLNTTLADVQDDILV